MTTIIYADILFVMNFCIDYICFYFVYKIINLKPKPIRIILASFIGAIYGIIDVIIDNSLISIFVLISMMLIGFEVRTKKLINITLLFCLFGSTIGGLSMMLYNINEGKGIVYLYVMISAVISLIYYKISLKQMNYKKIETIIVIDSVEYKDYGFVDSGNLLIDVYNGNKVILVKRELLGSDFTVEEKKGFRLIPANYRGEDHLKAFIPQKVIFKTKKQTIECLVTIAVDDTQGDYNGSKILIPISLIGEII